MSSPSTLFREEALEHYVRSSHPQGHVLYLSPRWMHWTYWLIVVVCVLAAIYVVCASLHEYATGIAIIRDEGRTQVTASSGGTITAITVQPGQHVEAAQELLRLNDTQEKIDLERRRQEFHMQQIHRLTHLHDAAAQQQLATLRAQVASAEKRLYERIIYAPRAGLVRDLRLRPQQSVSAGEFLLTLVSPEHVLSVIAILPGQYRPLLKPGSPLRLELSGFRYAYQRLTIDAVGNEVIGPQEVRRFLGQDVADAVAVHGSSVIVQARMPARTFYADGYWHTYHDGMQGTAEVRVRSEPMVLALVPGLKAAFGGEHGQDAKHSRVR